MKIVLVITCVILCACSKSEPKLPEGIKLKVVSSGDVVISLDNQSGIIVKQAEKDGEAVIIANLDDVLQSVQLVDGGKTPVGVEYTNADAAKITITRGSHSLMIDEDGDGIPETKIDKTGKFRLRTVEWEKVTKIPKPREIEQGGDAKRD